MNKKSITITLFSVFLLTSCILSQKSKKEEKGSKQTEDINITLTSQNREIRHLLVISYPKYGVIKTELQAFYTDGSIVNYTNSLTKTSIEKINKLAPDKSYYKNVNDTLFCFSNNGELLAKRNLSKRFESINTNNHWINYEWAMIDRKWLIRPEGMKIDPNFKEIPGTETYSLISVLLDGYCSYDKIEVDSTEWYQLSYLPEQRDFEITPVNLFTSEFYWECGDMNMYSINSDKENAVILFEGLKVNTGIVKSHFHEITCVIPGEDYTFSFNNKDYTLRAEGILDSHHYTIENEYRLSEEGRKETGNVYQEYKLYVEYENISQLILTRDNFSDRYVKIEFIGDLDGDELPDFIFETATWYEDFEKMLFLSSFAEKDELVKYVGHNGFSMAC